MAADPWLFATMRTLLKRVHALEATLQARKIHLSLADCISHPNFEIAERIEKGIGDINGELKLGFQWNPSAPEFHCAPEIDAGAHLAEAAVRAEGLLRESQDSSRSEMPAEMTAEKMHVSFAKEVDGGALKDYHATEEGKKEALLQDIRRAEALLHDFRTSGEDELGDEISFEYWDPHTSTRALDDDEDSDYNDDYGVSEEDLARFWGQEHTSTRARVDDEDSDCDDDSDSDNYIEISAEDWAKFYGAPPFIPAFSGDEDMIDNKNDCVNNVECDMALVITKAEKILEEFLPASTNSTVTDEIVFDYYLADNFTADAPADSDKVPEDDGYDEVLAALMLAYGCEANDLDDMPPDTAKEVRRARRRAAEAGAQESRERPFILNGYHCSRYGAVPVDSDACPRLPVL